MFAAEIARIKLLQVYVAKMRALQLHFALQKQRTSLVLLSKYSLKYCM